MGYVRIPTDLLDDINVQTLSPAPFKDYINMLLVANQMTERGTLPVAEDLAFYLRMTPDDVAITIEGLLSRRLLFVNAQGQLCITNWERFQSTGNDAQDLRRQRRIENNAHLDAKIDWGQLRTQVFQRDGWICQYCGDQGDGVVFHCDHVVPVCKGGTDEISNLITACAPCNLSKGGKTLAEWKGGAR